MAGDYTLTPGEARSRLASGGWSLKTLPILIAALGVAPAGPADYHCTWCGWAGHLHDNPEYCIAHALRLASELTTPTERSYVRLVAVRRHPDSERWTATCLRCGAAAHGPSRRRTQAAALEHLIESCPDASPQHRDAARRRLALRKLKRH